MENKSQPQSASRELALHLIGKLAENNLFVCETADGEPVKYFANVASEFIERIQRQAWEAGRDAAANWHDHEATISFNQGCTHQITHGHCGNYSAITTTHLESARRLRNLKPPQSEG